LKLPGNIKTSDLVSLVIKLGSVDKSEALNIIDTNGLNEFCHLPMTRLTDKQKAAVSLSLLSIIKRDLYVVSDFSSPLEESDKYRLMKYLTGFAQDVRLFVYLVTESFYDVHEKIDSERTFKDKASIFRTIVLDEQEASKNKENPETSK